MVDGFKEDVAFLLFYRTSKRIHIYIYFTVFIVVTKDLKIKIVNKKSEKWLGLVGLVVVNCFLFY